MSEPRISRTLACNFHCPNCKAKPGEPCMGARKPAQPRLAPHMQRYLHARRVLAS